MAWYLLRQQLGILFRRQQAFLPQRLAIDHQGVDVGRDGRQQYVVRVAFDGRSQARECLLQLAASFLFSGDALIAGLLQPSQCFLNFTHVIASP